MQRLSPRKIRWTQIYRRVNKKGISVEVRAKRTRRTVKHERAVVGASWDEIRAKRTEKPEARAAARQAAKDAKKSSKVRINADIMRWEISWFSSLLHSLLLPRRLKLKHLWIVQCSNKTTFNWRQNNIHSCLYI